jgi:hypothetical protein
VHVNDNGRTIVVFVRPAASERKSIEVLRWLRWMLPAALLVLTAAPPPAIGDPVIVIDADAVDAGPLAVAAAVARVTRGAGR